MRVLVLWAMPRQANLGVQALADGTAALVRRAFPDAEVAFQGTGGPVQGNDGPMNVGHLPPLAREVLQPRLGLRDWVRSFDLVVDTRGGDSFTDIYGLRRLAKLTPIGQLARRWGVPVVLGPQTIGPFTTMAGRRIARQVLGSASLVMVRDSHSADAAAGLGRPADVCTTDVVFALPRPERHVTRDVVLNVSGLLWPENPHIDATYYRAAVVDVVRALEAAGREVSLLAHVLPTHGNSIDNDLLAVGEAARALRNRHEVLLPTSVTDVRDMLASSRVVIGSRMHACLNALSVGTPALALAYSRKFAPLLEDLGWPWCFDLRDGDEVVPWVLEGVADESLEATAQRARTRADELTGLAVDALQGLMAARA